MGATNPFGESRIEFDGGDGAMNTFQLDDALRPVTGDARRLARLALDLHDGPLQDIAYLVADVRLFRDQLHDALSQERAAGLILGRLDDLEARLLSIDASLRELVVDSDPIRQIPGTVEDALKREVDELQLETGIEVTLELTGELDQLTRSQGIALFRVVQEALANVRKHSSAAQVEVEIEAEGSVKAEIVDDGQGFDVEAALVRAAHRGRLGIVGMAERVRLLGGRFAIDSEPGGPTRITMSLPEWRGSRAGEEGCPPG